MGLDDALIFTRVVECHSFTQAAQSLGMQKSTVSRRIALLEERLGVRLLNRTTRKVNVTADGAAYYERVIRLLADMDDAETSLSAAASAPRGRLRVDVPSPFASLILIPALPAFRERYPEIQLDLGVSDRHVDLIDDNVDCVVRGGAIAEQSLVARHVGDLRIGVYAAPGYLARAGVPAHPRELGDHQIISFLGARTRQAVSGVMRRGEERIALQGRLALAVDDGNAYLAAGLAGLGILWLPEYMAKAQRASGALLPLFEDWQLEPMPLYLAYPPNRHVSAKLRVFIDWVVELMAEHAPRVGAGEA